MLAELLTAHALPASGMVKPTSAPTSALRPATPADSAPGTPDPSHGSPAGGSHHDNLAPAREGPLESLGRAVGEALFGGPPGPEPATGNTAARPEPTTTQPSASPREPGSSR